MSIKGGCTGRTATTWQSCCWDIWEDSCDTVIATIVIVTRKVEKGQYISFTTTTTAAVIIIYTTTAASPILELGKSTRTQHCGAR